MSDTFVNSTLAKEAERYRGELRLHCYRMLGSLHDAEDAVQETLLRAWRHGGALREPSALRAWLYRIATNVCVDAMAKRPERATPEMLGPPSPSMNELEPAPDEAWVEPLPETWMGAHQPGPEASLDLRQSIELAFIAAVQTLAPRQRAALLLRDVVGFSAEETAGHLDISVAAANSALQRAREAIARVHGQRPNPHDVKDEHMHIARRYARAWEQRDLDAFLAVLAEDAVFSMPPWRSWFSGRDVIVRFFDHAWRHYRDCSGDAFRLVPLTASGQPGFACYYQQNERWSAHSLHVLRIGDDSIAHVTCYVRPLAPRLFEAFGLAPELTSNDGGSETATAVWRQ